MRSHSKLVLSASRRTDIPAFYMPWFMHAIDRGYFEVTNPYNRRVSTVPASTDKVGAIVFWSKNFGPFLENQWGRRLVDEGYDLFFNFTVNSPHPTLEPGLPPLADRLLQLGELSRQFGAGALTWRMDPICFFRPRRGPLVNNLDQVERLADAAAACGVNRCVTSFVDIYAKVKRRAERGGHVRFVDPALHDKLDTLLELESVLALRNIRLQTCCEKEVTAALPPESTITPSACISNERLMSIYGSRRLSTQKDNGQRVTAGCGCQVSVDIGSYDRHPCFHNCLFCYANPQPPQKNNKFDAMGNRAKEKRPKVKGISVLGPQTSQPPSHKVTL